MRSFVRSSVKTGGLILASVFLYSARANANGFEVGENGTEVMGRGGAWTARADTAIAAALNPAGLAGQKTNLLVNANLTWQSECFQRQGNYPDGGAFNTTNYPPDYYGKPYPEICKKNGFGDINVIPQLGMAYQVNSKLTIALLPLWTPSGTGKAVWPDDTLDERRLGPLRAADGTPLPSPGRFMLLHKEASIIMPTLGAGYEIVPGFRVGASFQWVITVFKSSVSSQGSQTSSQDLAQGPGGATRSDVSWTKLFTPAFVLGTMITPHSDFDIGGMFRYSADIVKNGGDVTITAPYYGKSSNPTNTPAETHAQVKEMRLPQPWDARLGFRWHPLRKGITAPTEGRRDFLAHDQFDVELDVTYSHNSSFDKLTVLFDPGQSVAFGSTVSASYIPPDASIEKHWKDTVGVRLGGEYVVIPDQLGIRLGGFFQTKGQDEQYLNLDFHPGQMLGLNIGATYRINKTVDVALGYGHIFVKAFDNTATGGQLRGLVGTLPDHSPASPDQKTYGICSQNGTPEYRTCDPVNTGRLTSSYNIVSLGTTIHF
ncbi:MAG: OmpP1/FadL family transporter [Polyangiales bacterium]